MRSIMNLWNLLKPRSEPDCRLQLAITVVIELDGDEFHAFCPALKGLHVYGASEYDAMESAREAIDVYLESLARHGDPLPVGPHLTVESPEPFRVPVGALLRHVELTWPCRHTSGVR